MHRKWKSVSALGMALLLGCLMPMNTMLAAEDDAEVVQEVEADSDTDEVSDAETISDDHENIDDESDAENENPDDEVNADDENADEEINAEDENVGDDANAEDENVIDETDADMDGQEGIQLMAVTEEPQAGDVEVQAVAAASLIDIKWNGNSYIYDMGGKIDYQYVNNAGQAFQITASQAGQEVSFSYYLDRVEDLTAEAKSASEIQWPDTQPTPLKIDLAVNTNYVLYVKAVADEQTVYARSGGVVIDTIAPKIVGVEGGKVYPAGTTFTVEDANLDVVMVNESLVTPSSDGSYKVKANGTNCMIRAKDKAGNEQTCSITVFGEEPEDNTVISKNGTYSLNAGTSYQLANGKWQVGGDSTVYQGGRTFYVRSDGDYTFKKR